MNVRDFVDLGPNSHSIKEGIIIHLCKMNASESFGIYLCIYLFSYEFERFFCFFVNSRLLLLIFYPIKGVKGIKFSFFLYFNYYWKLIFDQILSLTI